MFNEYQDLCLTNHIYKYPGVILVQVYFYFTLKGTVSEISNDPPCKDGNARAHNGTLETFIWSIMWEDGFLQKKCAGNFYRETTIENNKFSNL